MNLGEAISIFKNIHNSDRTSEEKKKAIKMVAGMENHNGITNREILDALVWMILKEDL